RAVRASIERQSGGVRGQTLAVLTELAGGRRIPDRAWAAGAVGDRRSGDGDQMEMPSPPNEARTVRHALQLAARMHAPLLRRRARVAWCGHQQPGFVR